MRVIKVNRRRGNIVLSRKAVLEERTRPRRSKTLEVLEEGVVMMGVVKNITDYGAFVDLGGIDGLAAHHRHVVGSRGPPVRGVQHQPRRSRW